MKVARFLLSFDGQVERTTEVVTEALKPIITWGLYGQDVKWVFVVLIRSEHDS
jgi:hypothetical protein